MLTMNIEEKVGELLRAKKMTLTTAESCTGGGVAALITSVPGSSEYFKGGIVAYSNEIKINLLCVSPNTLKKYGAVSQETVIEMAQGVMKSMKSDCAIATSGIAGPGGGTAEKPVGTVWMAATANGKTVTRVQHFAGNRQRVINHASMIAEIMLIDLLRGKYATNK